MVVYSGFIIVAVVERDVGGGIFLFLLFCSFVLAFWWEGVGDLGFMTALFN